MDDFMRADVAFAKAMVEFQKELPAVSKGNTADTGKYKYKYADLSDVTEAVLPALNRHGFTWLTMPEVTERGFVLRYQLMHEGGGSVSGSYHLPSGAPQDIGSAITYARRYALCAVTGVAPDGDDDDGKRATEAARKPAEPTLNPRDAVVMLEAATELRQLQGIWEQIGKAGVSGHPDVIAAKDAMKAKLA
jgi:hypothetical protein